jgi:hypothetical protein
MGPHNTEVLAGGDQMAAFERFVFIRRELQALLEETLAEDEWMLRGCARR